MHPSTIPLIDRSEDLADICCRLGQYPFVTVDTEFLRETTFWPKACLIQVASPEEEFAIDPLAPAMDLTPFFDLMKNEAVVKVFHAARQDIEIMWNLARCIPKPLFDTQIAAMVCGFGDQVSYSELVQAITKVSIDKSSRFTDWARRPLSDNQVRYALADVTYLRHVYNFLLEKLNLSKRLTWLDEELRVLTSSATYEQHPDQAWERLSHRVRKLRDLAILIELSRWREQEAQARDVPRVRILKDDILMEIVQAAPKSREALANLRAFPRGMERSKDGEDILACVQRGLEQDPKSLPTLQRERRNHSSSGATVELLKVLLRLVSEHHGVAPRMIASIDDLERLAENDNADISCLHGWRYDIFGIKALDLKHGILALTLEQGKVVALEWQDNPAQAEA